MKNIVKKAVLMMVITASPINFASAMKYDDPLLHKIMLELEYLPAEEDGTFEWDVDAWVGKDLHKVWLKSSGQRSNIREFKSEVNGNIELVYSRAAYTTWDQQFGIRHDFKSTDNSASRNWLSFGYIGLAPYFIKVDARIFVGEESSTQLLIELERETMLTQEWVLTAELDIITNGRTNIRYGEGSGFSELEFSLRLGYERNGNRKFQPFLGLTGHQTFGETKRFEKQQGNKSGDLYAMFGVHSWF